MIKRIVLLCVLLFMVIGVAGLGRTTLAAPTANRSADPVIISGNDLSDFIGDTITDVVVFAYNGSWQPIPFQLDEKMIEADDTEPDYVRHEDGLIDANDELVFMAQDAGVVEESWPADTAARQHPRLAVTINDSLGHASGTVYLYNSATLARSDTSYVTLDSVNERVNALSYTVGFDGASMFGVSDLFLNGQPTDLLDRQKVRLELSPFGSANENNLTAFPSPFTSVVTGPVRLIDGGDFGYAFYGTRFDTTVKVTIEALEAQLIGLQIQSMRISFDHNSPADTNVNSYFDSNGASVAIDGSADAVDTGSRNWYQVSGGALGGYVATFPTLTLEGGTLSTFYADNTAPSGDTGDGMQYADTGIFVGGNPSGILEIEQIAYILPPNTSNNMGAAFYQQAAMPLAATVVSQSFVTTAISLSNQTAIPVPQITLVIFILLLIVSVWSWRCRKGDTFFRL